MAALMSKLVAHEAEELCRVSDDAALLHDRIRWLQAVICDANRSGADRGNRAGHREGQSRVWARRRRDAAFDAEDALDDVMFQHQVALENQGCQNSRTQVRYFIGFFARMIVRRRISSQITRIMSTVDDTLDHQMDCRIERTPSVKLASSTTAIAAWRDDLENAMGLDKDVEVLKRMLVHKDEDSLHQMFISIVGESGTGKNTLIKKIVYDEICSSMDILIRYDMQPHSSIRDLITNVYQIALGQLADHCHEDEGDDKLRRLLSGKRYMLILGGISSKTTLNYLRASLPDDNNNGSRVVLILDIKNEEVAWHANTMNKDGNNRIHMMTCLNQDRSWQIFSWKVRRKGKHDLSSSIYKTRRNQKEEDDRVNYASSHEMGTNEEEEKKQGDGDNYDPSHKKEMNKEEEEDRYSYKGIYRHEQMVVEEEDEEKFRDGNFKRLVHDVTGGYPMAIVLLAGLLRFKERPIQWDAVLQQLNTARCNYHHQQTCNTRSSMETIFWASFEELTEDLKACYLHLVAYPGDTCQHADQIIQMWIAEGFINKKRLHHGKTLEDVGHDYIKELVLRCLVEVEETKSNGGIMHVRVHTSLLGLLRSEVIEVGFMEIIHNVIDDVLIPPLVRRIFIHGENNSMYTAHQKFPRLRSFICHIDEKKHKEAKDQRRCTKDKSMHEGLKFLCWSKFLRVVSVKGLRLEEVPDELGDMVHLRYLCIDCSDLRYLPTGIARLPNLQTLDVRNTQVEEIHQDFWKIKTLRHVLAKSLTLPRTMSIQAGVEKDDEACGKLQTLHGVKPPAPRLEGGWSLGNCSLDMMTNLRSLEMHGFMYATHGGATLGAALQNMHLLGHLKLQGDEIPSCVFTEPGLRHLETIVLNGIVKWDDIDNLVKDPLLLRKVRPNLIQLKVNDVSKVPQTIRDSLSKILVQGGN